MPNDTQAKPRKYLTHKRIADWLVDWRYEVPHAAYQFWLFAKTRPLLKCPFCEGTAGSMSSTEDGREWSECYECYHFWSRLDDCSGMSWFVGRVPVLHWIRAKVSMRMGLWFAVPLYRLLLCRLGYHVWYDHNAGFECEDDDSFVTCAHCWKPRESECSRVVSPSPTPKEG